jgi:predicted DNA-binding protein with PD1-like motif
MSATKKNFPFILRVVEGESLFSALKTFVRVHQFPSAIFTGIGALCNITIGFYHRHNQQHTVKNFADTYEIASLNGNITLADGNFFIHMHASVSDESFAVFGGHIIEAHASASTEIAITPMAYTITREYDPELKIFIIPSASHLMAGE